MKHLFIVNPVAGGKNSTESVRAQAEKLFAGRDEDYEIYVTRAPMDAASEIRRRAASGEELRVYACGGDGTFNECCCGAAELPNVAVCPFPTGTGNDFCRMFGEEAALFHSMERVVNGAVVPIDLIRCNDRWSVNICSVGIDARIGMNVHKYSRLPLIGGAGGYIISAVVEIFRGIASPMRVRSGDFFEDREQTLVCACNGCYYGGGFHPCPTARINDGIMDVFVVKKVKLPQVPFLIGRYASGRADEMTRFITHLRTRELTVEFDKESVINLDGEAVYAKKAELSLVPGALRLIVPRGMQYFSAAAGEESGKTSSFS